MIVTFVPFARSLLLTPLIVALHRGKGAGAATNDPT
jgi:hypothetical protein